jgi:hypothetical protein
MCRVGARCSLLFALAIAWSAAAAGKAVAQPVLQPANGLTCLIVNKNSGRCLSIADGATNPGAKVVQGPLPDQAGAAERWTLLGDGKTFRLRNCRSRLALEIGNANPAPGVQAIQWHVRNPAPHQVWTFEPSGDHYLLRVSHADFVLGVQEGSQEAGARVIQWQVVPDVPDQLWELRPAFQEAYWSFQGNPDKRGDFELIGPDAAECVKFDAEGLRISLPLGFAGRRPSTGVAKYLDLKGDFEITIGYQIIGEPAAADTGLGTGLFLGIDLDAERNRATFTRGVRDRAVLTSWFELTEKGADKPHRTGLKSQPTTDRAGQLRITRQGSELLFEAAGPAGADFTLLDRQEFSDQDVHQIRIGGDTGGPRASLDARILDLRIRARSLPGQAAAVPPAPAPGPADETPPRLLRSWLGAVLVLGVVVVLMGALALVGWVALRRRSTPSPATPKPDRAKAKPERRQEPRTK